MKFCQSKRYGIGIAGVALLGAALLITGACGDDDGGGGGGDLSSFFDATPSNASEFTYADFDEIRAHDDLDPLIEAIEDEASAIEDQFDIDLDDADVGASMTIDGDDSYIIHGDFDRDDLIDTLEDEEFDEDEISGLAVWNGLGSFNGVVFLDDETYAFAYLTDDAEDIAQASEGDRSSFGDDDDVQDVFDRLPKSGILELDIDTDCGRAACAVLGITFTRTGSAEIGLHYLLIYDSEEDAEDDEEDFESALSDSDELRNVEVSRDGRFLEADAEVDVDDIF